MCICISFFADRVNILNTSNTLKVSLQPLLYCQKFRPVPLKTHRKKKWTIHFLNLLLDILKYVHASLKGFKSNGLMSVLLSEPHLEGL